MGKNSYNTTEKQKERMVNALEINYGNIRRAAMVAGISPQTHFRWCKEDHGYDTLAETAKDVGYRNLKDNVMEMALNSAVKGNATVLVKMMGVLFKHLPDEMRILNRYNHVPIQVRIRPISSREELNSLEE